MRFLKRIWGRLRAIQPRTYLFSLAAIVILVVALGGVVYAWDYTNSPPFCGTTCHTMPPEYAAYQVSPHARVSCVECHIGRTFVGNAFTRKTGDLMHVVRYSSNQYTFPLYAHDMLPARESCEKCHWPEKLANDKVINVKHFDTDIKNTVINTLLVMKTGGGTERQGLGLGIHWHIENQVNFIATDPLKQNIPWVQVIDAKGKETIYSDVQSPLTADEIAKAEKRRMDCIDCHNRISHKFRSPDQAMDNALALNQISADIPFIKQKGVQLLSAQYSSFEDANKAIDQLTTYYSETYPDFYSGGTQSIKTAVAVLKQTYADLVFPTQDLSWTTHPDNIGHKDSPGCYRCHDGKHLTADNKNAIRLECNICHTLPQVARAGAPAPVVSVTKGDEPESHRATTWLAQHRTAFNASCQQCHDTRNAGGKDNSSFCSNSACHANKWVFAGLDAPALAKLFLPPVAPRPQPGATAAQIPHPIGGSPDCQICHGANSKVRPYPSDHQGRTNDQCLACHVPAIPPGTQGLSVSGPPNIPHELQGRAECLGCHSSGASGVPQVPKFHKDYEFPNTGCVNCHKQITPGTSNAPAPAATATPTAQTTETSAAPAASGPPALPADHAGRTACLACHGSGVANAPKPPASHASYTDALCTGCHKPKQ